MEEKIQWSIRPVGADELSQVMQIEKRSHVSPWTQEQFQAEIQKPYCQVWVVTDDETDEKLAGYIVFWLLFDECQILNLAIDLPYRGLGLARMMTRKAIGFVYRKGIQKIALEVRKSNMAAIQLYQSLGFLITHVRKGYYSNGEDAYHMILNLNQAPLEF